MATSCVAAAVATVAWLGVSAAEAEAPACSAEKPDCTIPAGFRLNAGRSVPIGSMTLRTKADGNLVFYGPGNAPLWATSLLPILGRGRVFWPITRAELRAMFCRISGRRELRPLSARRLFQPQSGLLGHKHCGQ